jgi:hypothetical protein
MALGASRPVLVGGITKQNSKYTGQLALFRYKKSRWHWENASQNRQVFGSR